MGSIAKKFRTGETHLGLHVSVPPPSGPQVSAFCYDDNLLLENETLGRLHSIDLDNDHQALRMLVCKWTEG